MSNIYLKVIIEAFSKPQFSGFKKCVHFKASCCNLKIRGLGTKLCVTFLLFWFWKELLLVKDKKSMHFVEEKYKL